MDQATTRGLLHFHLTTFEDDESSTSAMRSDILKERVQAFKSTPRSAWKMGLDLSLVSLGTEKGRSSTVLAVVCSLSPAPSSVEHSCVSQWSSEAKNRF
nr:hypothetical protein CFP56_64336 [Quercus suber]